MLIHQILNDLTQNLNFETEKNYKNNTLKQKNNFPLIKEIRLRHGAPIVNIEVIQVCLIFLKIHLLFIL